MIQSKRRSRRSRIDSVSRFSANALIQRAVPPPGQSGAVGVIAAVRPFPLGKAAAVHHERLEALSAKLLLAHFSLPLLFKVRLVTRCILPAASMCGGCCARAAYRIGNTAKVLSNCDYQSPWSVPCASRGLWTAQSLSLAFACLRLFSTDDCVKMRKANGVPTKGRPQKSFGDAAK